MPVSRKLPLLSEQIRNAVNASGMSRYRICKTIGCAEATMSRFMNLRGGLSMEVLDRLGELLALRVTSDKQSR
jgi:transcriptional regulator with XRE-family HTH domain